jgi:lysozyme
VWTIGWGETEGVKEGDEWTQDQADARLRERIAEFAKGVAEAAQPVEPHQLDALTSFAYNVGLGRFLGSTLLAKHLRPQPLEAAPEFLRWVKAGGRKLYGLERRRRSEAVRYLGGSWELVRSVY